MRPVLWCIILAALWLSACQESTHTPVPRRTAYPRPYTYDTTYCTVPGLPLHIEINSQIPHTVTTKDDGSVWLNLSYPRYDAMVYCTFTPVDSESIDEVVANRTERISLNIGSVPTNIEESANDRGFHNTIVTALSPVSTPIQFISIDEDMKWVLSGTAFFDRIPSDASIDSISPLIEAIRTDIDHTLQSLSAI